MKTSSSNLIRWCGLAYVVGGLSLIIQQLLHSASPEAAGAWVAVHSLGYFGLVFGLLGLVGVYACQMEQVGRLGLIGFVMAFIGNGLTVGAAFLDSYVQPVLFVKAPDLVGFPPKDPALFAGPLGLVVLLAALIVTIGFILFGIATVRAGVLPRWAAGLIILSSWFGLAAVFSQLVFTIGAIVFGLGNAGLGFAVWSGQGEKAGQLKPTM